MLALMEVLGSGKPSMMCVCLMAVFIVCGHRLIMVAKYAANEHKVLSDSGYGGDTLNLVQNLWYCVVPCLYVSLVEGASELSRNP